MAYFIVGLLYHLVCSLNSCYFITFIREKCQKGLCSLTKSWRGATDPSRNGFGLQVAFCPQNAPCTAGGCKTSRFCRTQDIGTQINNWPSASLKTQSGILWAEFKTPPRRKAGKPQRGGSAKEDWRLIYYLRLPQHRAAAAAAGSAYNPLRPYWI